MNEVAVKTFQEKFISEFPFCQCKRFNFKAITNKIKKTMESRSILHSFSDAATLVDVNIFVRSFSAIDDVKMVSEQSAQITYFSLYSQTTI